MTSDHTIVRWNQIPDPVILVWEHTVCVGLGLIRGHFRMAPQPGVYPSQNHHLGQASGHVNNQGQSQMKGQTSAQRLGRVQILFGAEFGYNQGQGGYPSEKQGQTVQFQNPRSSRTAKIYSPELRSNFSSGKVQARITVGQVKMIVPKQTNKKQLAIWQIFFQLARMSTCQVTTKAWISILFKLRFNLKITFLF